MRGRCSFSFNNFFKICVRNFFTSSEYVCLMDGKYPYITYRHSHSHSVWFFTVMSLMNIKKYPWGNRGMRKFFVCRNRWTNKLFCRWDMIYEIGHFTSDIDGILVRFSGFIWRIFSLDFTSSFVRMQTDEDEIEFDLWQGVGIPCNSFLKHAVLCR